MTASPNRVLKDSVQGNGSQHRQEEKQAAELGAERCVAEVESPDIGDIRNGGPGSNGTFVIGSTWQASEAFLLEDLRDGNWAERVALVTQVAADVVDREVLLAQRDDLIAEGIGFGSGSWPFSRGTEEVATGILAELMDQDAEAPRGIAEAAGCLVAGKSVDEVGAEGFVLAMG